MGCVSMPTPPPPPAPEVFLNKPRAGQEREACLPFGCKAPCCPRSILTLQKRISGRVVRFHARHALKRCGVAGLGVGQALFPSPARGALPPHYEQEGVTTPGVGAARTTPGGPGQGILSPVPGTHVWLSHAHCQHLHCPVPVSTHWAGSPHNLHFQGRPREGMNLPRDTRLPD